MKKKADIACLNCGKLFHARRKDSKFCCRQCSIEYNTIHGKYIKTEEIKNKLSESSKGRVAWNKGKKTDPEVIAKFKKSISSVWTDEKKELQSIKQKEVWSDPKLLERHSKQAIALIESNPEIRKKISEGVHRYNSKLSDEEWTNRYKKAYITKSLHGNSYISSGEKDLQLYLDSLGIKYKKYIVGKGDSRFEIDCYIADKKIGIEYNGIYYHSVNGRNRYRIGYHYNKSKIAKEFGISLIHVWEDQWKNKNAIVKDILATRLGVNSFKRIYARNCKIMEVDRDTYCNFCNENHIQGYRIASIRLGLYYEGKLVQLASFGRARSYVKSDKGKWEYEWIRGVTLRGYSIIGGTSKLFKYFVRLYNPINVLCYCDWNYFEGLGYESCGFKFVGYTGPDLFFVKNNSMLERLGRNPSKNREYKDLVLSNRLYECHGSGSKKFIWGDINKKRD